MASSSGASAGASGSSPAAATSIQNIDIRVPKGQNKKYAIMRFNGSMGVDFVKWTNVKMERENNQVQFKGFNEDMPKFGAGSEYGREAREEARRKKYGIISRKYKPEDQPWILQHGSKGAAKKLRGVRDGGVTENASYYVLTQAPDNVFEAFPVQEQYSFQAVQNYKALSYEEAEEEFSSRSRTFNLFNVMVRKRMKKNDEDGDDDGEEEGEIKGKGKKKKNAKDSHFGDELEDMDSSNGESSDDDDDNDDGDGDGKKKKKKKGKKPVKPKKKRKNGSDDEPLEDSDDGDGEGRELDYISSSDEDSDVDIDAKDGPKGVAEEDALRKLLNSDEEDEDEEKEDDEDKDKDEEDAEGGEDHPGDKSAKDEKDDKKKKKDKKKSKDKKPRKEEYGSSSDSGESSESELEKAKPSPKPKSNSANSSRSATPTKPATLQPEALSDSKRKGLSEAILAQAAKKSRMDLPSAASSATSAALSSTANEGVNEESVRRYLSRKPMTTTELLQKFKSKRTGLTSDQLVTHIAQILKKINPVKQTIKGKMYLSIKG